MKIFGNIKDVSFQISSKKMTALVGPSGSGKTTLARFNNIFNRHF